ncbi:hypothetical protein PGTUg99_032802 [Puccinia graminis f. sp. tritici]|uniref:Uncharacterized protein n=1 Tax=Puccinia graminis f. sp. tritici TaxID=56615 RepID=A0A5B0RXP1_PUCGR|nr:hypothetical protein PGTUg99_032802 [Puccinia graminis f. sp. tritici]
MDSLNRDSQPRFSESCRFSGSNGLATRLDKGIQGHLDSPKPAAFVESPPDPTTQPTPQIHCPHRTNFNFDMPVEVDVESSAQKTPVAKEKSNKNKDKTPLPKSKQAVNDDESADPKPKQPKPPKWQPNKDQSLCTSWQPTGLPLHPY